METALLTKFQAKQENASLETLANLLEFLSSRPRLMTSEAPLMVSILEKGNSQISEYLDEYLKSEFVDFNGSSFENFQKSEDGLMLKLKRLVVSENRGHLSKYSGKFGDLCLKLSGANINNYWGLDLKKRNSKLQSVIKLKQVKQGSAGGQILKYDI